MGEDGKGGSVLACSGMFYLIVVKPCLLLRLLYKINYIKFARIKFDTIKYTYLGPLDSYRGKMT